MAINNQTNKETRKAKAVFYLGAILFIICQDILVGHGLYLFMVFPFSPNLKGELAINQKIAHIGISKEIAKNVSSMPLETEKSEHDKITSKL